MVYRLVVFLSSSTNYQVTAPAGALYSEESPVSVVVQDLQKLTLSSGPSISKAPVRPGDPRHPPHLRCLATTSVTPTPLLEGTGQASWLSLIDGQSINNSKEKRERELIHDEDGVVDITDEVKDIRDDAYYSDSEFDQDDDYFSLNEV